MGNDIKYKTVSNADNHQKLIASKPILSKKLETSIPNTENLSNFVDMKSEVVPKKRTLINQHEPENLHSDDSSDFDDFAQAYTLNKGKPKTPDNQPKPKRIAISSIVKGFNEQKIILSRPARIPSAAISSSVDPIKEKKKTESNSVKETRASTANVVYSQSSTSNVEAKETEQPTKQPVIDKRTNFGNQNSNAIAKARPPEPLRPAEHNDNKINTIPTTTTICKSTDEITSKSTQIVPSPAGKLTATGSNDTADFSQYSFKRIVQNRIEKSADGTEKMCERIILSDVKSTEYLQHQKDAKNASAREKRSQCAECGKIMSSSVLRMHISQHTDIKRYACDICGKLFTRKSHIEFHMRIHMNVKPITCELCGLSFRKRSNMTAHKQSVHSNVCRFACEVCNRQFKRKAGVLLHMTKHTGATPYKCEKCLRQYKSPSGLRKHRRKFPACVPERLV